MKNITTILSEEHQNILKMIDLVMNECEQLENGKEIDVPFFQNVISFIKNYADGFHHKKEEDILFKTMLEQAEYLHCNPIPVMLHEHDEGRHYVRGMEEALLKKNADALGENARNYGFLLQEHIYKEDNILYPMAEEALSEDQKEQVEMLYGKVNPENFFDKEINLLLEELAGMQTKEQQ